MEVKTGAETAYSVRRHSHEELCIGFVEKGSSTVVCASMALCLKVNDAVLIPPQAVHLCRPSEPDKFRFTMAFVDPKWIRQSLGLDVLGIRGKKARLNDKDRETKTRFFEHFETPGTRLQMESLAVLFLARLLFEVFNLDPAAKKKAQDSPGTAQKARNFLDRYFTEDVRLRDLEKTCGRNKYAIIREFRKAFALTPHAYVLDRRINLARTLLAQNNSVAHTAAECGFFDQSHFIKTFKTFTGINPAEYKNR